jgi:hypothetical protein
LVILLMEKLRILHNIFKFGCARRYVDVESKAPDKDVSDQGGAGYDFTFYPSLVGCVGQLPVHNSTYKPSIYLPRVRLFECQGGRCNTMLKSMRTVNDMCGCKGAN